MIYWLTGTAGSAAYVGYAQHEGWGVTKENSGVPTAAIVFAHDVAIRRYAEADTPSPGGSTSIAVGTSPRWRSRRSCWLMFANSSETFG